MEEVSPLVAAAADVQGLVLQANTARGNDGAQISVATAAPGAALALLDALSAEGIQAGHMRLHARNVAVEAGARGSEVPKVASTIADQGTVNITAAIEALRQMHAA